MIFFHFMCLTLTTVIYEISSCPLILPAPLVMKHKIKKIFTRSTTVATTISNQMTTEEEVKPPKTLNLTVQQAFVDAHNIFRANVSNGSMPNQPGASNMEAVVWNVEIAMVAQKWADTSACYKRLTHNTNVTSFGLGENAYWSSQHVQTDEERINIAYASVQGWFSENSLYTYPFNFSAAYGHYTQLIWATSSQIGCGISTCAINNSTVVFCNYMSPGNFNKPPYTLGNPCSNCPSYRNECTSDGLCSSSNTTWTGLKCYSAKGTQIISCPPWFDACGWRIITKADAGIEQIMEVGCTARIAPGVNCTHAYQPMTLPGGKAIDTYWCTCDGNLCNNCNEIWCPGYSFT